MSRKITVSAKLEYIPTNFNSRTAHYGKKQVLSWDLASMPIDPNDFLFCRVRACSADEPNRNGDAFPYDELKKAYNSFIGKGVYQDHKTDSVDDMRGIILDAVWREADQKYEGGHAWVELLIAVDKGYEDLCRKVMKGAITDVSMGCTVKAGECSICGNVCRGETDVYGNLTDMCDHIKYHKGEIWNGKRVYEKCYDVEFMEISAVTDGADPQAIFLDKNIVISNELPDHIKSKVVAMPNFNEGMKKVASSVDYDDVLVKDLPQELSEKVFNACKKANANNYWTTFDEVQHRTLKQAKAYIKKVVAKHLDSIKADLNIFDDTEEVDHEAGGPGSGRKPNHENKKLDEYGDTKKKQDTRHDLFKDFMKDSSINKSVKVKKSSLSISSFLSELKNTNPNLFIPQTTMGYDQNEQDIWDIVIKAVKDGSVDDGNMVASELSELIRSYMGKGW